VERVSLIKSARSHLLRFDPHLRPKRRPSDHSRAGLIAIPTAVDQTNVGRCQHPVAHHSLSGRALLPMSSMEEADKRLEPCGVRQKRANLPAVHNRLEI